MTLSGNDTSGQRGEGYMLVPLKARSKNAIFWGWPAAFHKTAAHTERRVSVLDGAATAEQRIYFHDGKSEFRLCTDLYFAGAAVGSLLLVEREPSAGIDYSFSIVPKDDHRFAELISKATLWAGGASDKRFGYF
jgi:hypothetical protein